MLFLEKSVVHGVCNVWRSMLLAIRIEPLPITLSWCSPIRKHLARVHWDRLSTPVIDTQLPPSWHSSLIHLPADMHASVTAAARHGHLARYWSTAPRPATNQRSVTASTSRCSHHLHQSRIIIGRFCSLVSVCHVISSTICRPVNCYSLFLAKENLFSA